MKPFAALIEILQRNPERVYNGAANPSDRESILMKEEILSVIEHSKFIVNDALFDELQHGDIGPHEPNLDVTPPFKTCWIQLPNTYKIGIELEPNKAIEVYGIFIHEIEPHFYICAIISDDPVEPTKAFRFQTAYINALKDTHKNHYAWKIIATFLRPFSRQYAIGTVKTSERIKFKRDGEKIIHKIRQVIHVCSKTKSSIREAEEKYQIDWSHRWSVRGHWRQIPGLGKDRAGDYVVRGWTWVSDHIKGPEHKPFVEKTRVIDRGFFRKNGDE